MSLHLTIDPNQFSDLSVNVVIMILFLMLQCSSSTSECYDNLKPKVSMTFEGFETVEKFYKAPTSSSREKWFYHARDIQCMAKPSILLEIHSCHVFILILKSIWQLYGARLHQLVSLSCTLVLDFILNLNFKQPYTLK